VAGAAIQNPRTPDLGLRADRAGNRVIDAARTYVRAAQATLD
jgi:hypothetical protein